MHNSLTPRAPLEMGALSDPAELGRMLAASGYFSDVKEAAQAVVKVLAGAELGIPPIRAMMSIYIVQGKVTLSAETMAGLVKRSAKYDYKVRERKSTRAAIAFFEDGEEQGISEFTLEDAQTAGLTGKDIWRKYPANMLFWRAMSNGVSAFCPDVFGGPIYTPEEMGAEIDEDGGVITDTIEPEPEAKPRRARKPKAAPEPEPEPEPEPVLAAPTAEIDGRTVDQQTGEVLDFAQPSAPDETPEAPVPDAAEPAGTSSESAAPADGGDPITNAEMAKLIEYLDRLGAPDSFRQMAALAAGVEDLAQLTKDQAREVMTKAKARYGS